MTFAGDPLAATAFGESLIAAASGASVTENPFFAEMQAMAAEMLATGTGFGQRIRLRRRVETETGDPLAPYEAGFTDHQRNALVLGFSAEKIDGVRVFRSDRRVVMDPKGLEIAPRAGDAVILGGVNHAVVDVMPIPAVGTVCLYVLHARVGG